jgi:hypothetical protein
MKTGASVPPGFPCPQLSDAIADPQQAMSKRQTTEITKSRRGATTNCPTTIPGTADTETLDRRFRTMEAASLRLQKEAKGYLDSLRGTADGRLARGQLRADPSTQQ